MLVCERVEIPYNYTVEVKNRFKGLDLTDRVPWRTMDGGHALYRGQWARPSPRKGNAKKGKMVVWQSLTNSREKKRS